MRVMAAGGRSNLDAIISQPNEVYDILVRDLMIPVERRWNVGKIRSLFPSHVVQHILSDPLFPNIEVDNLIWTGKRNGIYSV